MRLAAALILLLALVARAHAAVGDLDLGFGEGGIAQVNFRDDMTMGASASAVVVQPDGRIVAAGWGNNEGALVRYLTDGTLDPSFGRQGRVLLPYALTVVDLELQSDGALIAVGSSFAYGSALVRVLGDGTLDRGFGSDGVAGTPLRAPGDGAMDLVVLPDDSLALAGAVEASPPNFSNFAAARFTADGTLDTGFGIGGLATIDLSSGGDYATALTVRPDGGLVLAGAVPNTTDTAVAIARLTATGDLDTAFGNGGVVVVDLSSFADVGVGVANDGAGAVVVAASTVISSQFGVGMIRLLDDGSLDSSFGVGGIARGATRALPYGFVRTSDGRWAVTGTDGSSFITARFTPSGALDATFEGDGVVETAIGSAPAVAWAIAAAPDGTLVAAGETRTRPLIGFDEYRFALIRYTENGSLDPTFGGAGIVTTGIGSTFDRALAVAAQPDGRLILAGTSEQPVLGDFALARLNADGTADPSFGINGTITTSHGDYWEEIRGVVVQPDGRIVAAGFAYDGTQNAVVLVRHNADGSVDSSFGVGGVVRVPSGIDIAAYALARQADGRLVAAGYLSDAGISRIGLVRYDESGALDPTFGSGGVVSTAIGGAAEASALAIQPDGKLVVAGVGNSRLVVVRYLTDGTLDASFGTAGVVTLLNAQPRALALQPDGDILVAGRAIQGPQWKVFLARWHADGTADTDFGSEGVAFTDLDSGGNGDHADAIALLPSGAIAVGGSRSLASETQQVMLFYPPDGNSVAMQTLTTGGPYGLRSSSVSALLVQPDGKLVAVGTNGDFLTVRYRGEYVGCPALPLSCRAAARTVALVKSHTDAARHHLVWKWLRGAPTNRGELGDPRVDASYALCVYAGDPPRLAGQAMLPADPLRWRTLGEDGYVYRDAEATQDGIEQLQLKGSDHPRSRIFAVGHGAALPDLPLPLAPPVTFQLVNQATNLCWGSTLDSGAIRRNDERLFRARQ